MKFTIDGADKRTGDDHTVIITANDAQDAEYKAKLMGLLVNRVNPREVEAVATPLNYAAHEQATIVTPAPPPAKTPKFIGIQMGEFVLCITGLFSIGVGVLVFFSFVSHVQSVADVPMISLIASVPFVVLGVGLWGLAWVCEMLRNIARAVSEDA